jgi:hypothetical protein
VKAYESLQKTLKKFKKIEEKTNDKSKESINKSYEEKK